ncbi:MAG TPA: penicillin-binding transpeptidase domain-containing protein [Thermoleophilaceae bacterium]|nr:penicillin-binding transpeptidase domain-containing protein [Thermoleophilaceae bacterium]
MTPDTWARRRGAVLAALAALAFVVGLLAGAFHESAAKSAARDFAQAWEDGDYGGMWRQLTAEAQGRVAPQELEVAYRDAMATATATGVETGDVEESGDTVSVDVALETRVFGTVEGTLELPMEADRVDWAEHLTFPGLDPGESLERTTRAPRRAKILARDGSTIAEGPASARTSPLGLGGTEIVGTVAAPATEEERDALHARGFEQDTPVGISGLERILEDQVAGKPGGRLVAGGRILATAEPRRAAPVKTTIDVGVQQAVTTALAGRFGGIAALDARTAEVRGLAGIAFSAAQPPGSTFKIITATAALERELVKPRTEFPIETYATIDGVQLENANGEACGGDFVETFAHSCNSVFAPLGVRIGARELVETAERYGFNADPVLPGAAPSTLPAAEEIASDLELGATAIGQGRVLATPLLLASMSQTIASGGVLRTPTVVRGATRPAPVRVTSRRVAGRIERMMVAVVNYGTGTAASLAPIGVAGKTGTAELEDTTDEEDIEQTPGTDTDAWFTAYAPVNKPELAVAVLLVRNGAGGETAAPAARLVLDAALD